jgi:hypothetical protein
MEAFALKGRELSGESGTYSRAKSQSAQLRGAATGTLDPTSTLLVRSIWRPFRARRSGVIGFGPVQSSASLA